MNEVAKYAIGLDVDRADSVGGEGTGNETTGNGATTGTVTEETTDEGF